MPIRFVFHRTVVEHVKSRSHWATMVGDIVAVFGDYSVNEALGAIMADSIFDSNANGRFGGPYSCRLEIFYRGDRQTCEILRFSASVHSVRRGDGPP